MMSLRRHTTVTAHVAIAGLIMGNTVLMAQETAPQDWLNRMASAVQSTNYQGTVIRLQDGRVEALKVAHSVSDGVVREKVIIQEGNGLEIIRHGNEVQCILPDKQSVLVEEWDDQSTLFSTLPSSDVRFGSEYDVSVVREERVAGRKAVLLAIRPHDGYRYGHRIWLDTETGFPLQTKLIGDDGEAIEQIKFADITLDEEIHASALASSINTDNFRWFTQPRRSIVAAVDSRWSNDNLPSGFRLVSNTEEELPGRDVPVTHILFSDGLANVSVFIEPADRIDIARRSRVGSSHSYSIETGGFQVTAVGEVPAATVEQIATSMQYK
ncbi:MAG: MucB/RseB C-terminal domain-containing protein [Gammaproteobacteria bacterium]|nr:MucB/RseB C-terminal domain-containing protein [Gammaproteobacteria bacterium]